MYWYLCVLNDKDHHIPKPPPQEVKNRAFKQNKVFILCTCDITFYGNIKTDWLLSCQVRTYTNTSVLLKWLHLFTECHVGMGKPRAIHSHGDGFCGGRSEADGDDAAWLGRNHLNVHGNKQYSCRLIYHYMKRYDIIINIYKMEIMNNL